MAVHSEEHCDYTGPGCGHKECPHGGSACPYCLCNYAGTCGDCDCEVDDPDKGCECSCHYDGMSDDELRRTERHQMGIC